MSITSASSVADLEAAFIDNADYEAQASIEKAQTFVQACRRLLLRRPSAAKRSTGVGSFSAQWNTEALKSELDRALQWLSFAPAAQADGGVVFPSFQEARDYDSGASAGSVTRNYGDQTV